MLAFIWSCGRNLPVQTPVKEESAVVGPDEIRVSPDAMSAIEIIKVTSLSANQKRVFPGKIQYDDDKGRSSRISSPVVGRVVETPVRLGEHVVQGDILSVIESQEIGTAFSDYIKAQSDHQSAKRAVELARDLYEAKGISRKELQQAENDELKARAEFFRAKERLLNLRVSPADLDQPVDQQKIRSAYTLRSPLTGIVVERNISPGQIVGNDPAQVLFTVANLASVIAVADISDKELTLITRGAPMEVLSDAYPERKFSGKVVYVSDLVDPATHAFKFRCRIENVSGLLKPEMFVRIAVVSGKPGVEVPAIPASALIRDGERDIVFVRNQAGHFVRRKVVMQEMVDAGQDQPVALIREGLKPGEEIVVRGGILLQNLFSNPS